MTPFSQFRSGKPRSWRVHEWPAPDREKWGEAFARRSIILPAKSAAHLGTKSQTTLEQAYGMFLDHVARVSGPFCLQRQSRPIEFLVPRHVENYDAELAIRVGSVTRYESICKLRRAAQILDPERDLSWLREIERHLASLRKPADKRHRMVESRILLNAGLRLMDQQGGKLTAMRAIKFRDGLMVALMSLCPIRLTNFANLRIGADFRYIGANWWITLPAASTKTRRGDDRMVSGLLTQSINRYVEVIRPVVKPDNEQLWVGFSGRPLSYSGVQRCITKAAEDLTGIRVSPHLFRACAATTAYVLAPHLSNLPSSLLQHADPSVTQKHYNKAPAAVYAERFRKLVEE
jgi:integrase